MWRFHAPRTLGSQNAAEIFRVEIQEQVVVQHSGGMNHSVEGRHRVSNLSQRAGQIVFIRNIRLDRRYGGAFGRQFGHDLSPSRGCSTAAEKDEVPRALFHQPARDFEPQSAVPARDQIRCVGSRSGRPLRTIPGFGSGKGNHNLPDIFAPGHVTKRVCRILDGENIVRERLEAAQLKHGDQFKQERAEQRGPFAANALQIESKIGKIIAKWEQAQRLVLINVGLADFDEAAVRGEDRKAAGNVFAGERVENHVDAVAAGRFHNFVGERERTRVQDMRHSPRFQVRALLRRAGGGENFRAGVLGQLHCGKPHAASRGVNQHALSAGKLGEMVEGIVGRKKRDRNGGCLSKAEYGWLWHNGTRIRSRVGAEAAVGYGDHLVACFPIRYARADGGNYSRALGAKGNRSAGIYACGIHHIAKVQARGIYTNLNFARKRLRARRSSQQQVLKISGTRSIQAK